MSEKLIVLPALIDPHVHFRTPGGEHKENWITASRAAISGGITTVLDMPNTSPPTLTVEALEQKQTLINQQLEKVQVPLRYGLYLGADEKHLDQIGQTKNPVKIYMGSSTGDLFFGSDEALEKVFAKAAQEGVVVAIHAEDELLINQQKEKYASATHVAFHSKIRCREAAQLAVAKAIKWAIKYQTSLYIAHVSTAEELALIKEGKKRGPIYAEATPHHLFLDESAYASLGTFAQVNPPLRTKEDREALWEGIADGTIDTIGSDHAPHTIEEKEKPFGQAPSGVPGVETLLPLMLKAVHEKKLSLKRLVELTREAPLRIFNLPDNDDVVVVDLNERRTIENKGLFTQCGWTPFEGIEVTGWPVYTKVKNKLFKRGIPVETPPEGVSLDLTQDNLALERC